MFTATSIPHGCRLLWRRSATTGRPPWLAGLTTGLATLLALALFVNMGSGQEKKTKPLQTFEHKRVKCMAFSPDGKLLATGGADKDVRLWDVQAGKELYHSGKEHKKDVCCLAFSPDGKKLASADSGGGVVLWGITGTTEPKKLHSLVHNKSNKGKESEGHRVLSLSFSPGGDWLASSGTDGVVTLWDLREEPVVAKDIPSLQLSFSKQITPDRIFVAFASDGKRLAVFGFSTKDHRGLFVRLLDSSSAVSIQGSDKDPKVGDEFVTGMLHKFGGTEPESRKCESFTFADNGGRLVALLHSPALLPDGRGATEEGPYRLASWQYDKERHSLAGFSPEFIATRSGLAIRIAVLSPDAKILAAEVRPSDSAKLASVKLWKLSEAELKELVTLEENPRELVGLVFSANGKRLATADRDGKVKLWEVPAPR